MGQSFVIHLAQVLLQIENERFIILIVNNKYVRCGIGQLQVAIELECTGVGEDDDDVLSEFGDFDG